MVIPIYVSTSLLQMFLWNLGESSFVSDEKDTLSYRFTFIDMVLQNLDKLLPSCFVRITASKSDIDSFTDSMITLAEPFQLFNIAQGDGNLSLRKGPKEYCWNIFIFVPIIQNSSLSANLTHHASFIKSIGHPLHDNFVFISAGYENLQDFLTKTDALNVLRKKIAVYLETIPDQVGNIKFLTEPSLYTGSFVNCASFPHLVNTNNLNGRVIKLVHLNFGLTFKQIGNQRHAGVYFDLLDDFSKRFNFSMDMYNEHFPPGELDKNGSWSGLVGQLQHGPADVCAALGISYDRYPYVDYSTTTYHAPITFTVKEPIPKLHWNALLSPLTIRVWLFTLGSLLGLTATFVLLEYPGISQKQAGRQRFFAGLVEATLSPLMIVLEQDVNISRKVGMVKAMVLLCILLSFVVGTAYKSNLVGFLTFPEKPLFPKSFSDLFNQKEYKLVLISPGGLELNVFKSTLNPMVVDFSKRLKIVPMKDAGQCMDEQMRSKTVCVSWRNVVLVGAIKFGLKWPKSKRSVYLVDDRDPLFSFNIATVFKKNSIFQVALNNWLGIARDSGIVGKFVKKFWNEETQRLKRSVSAEKGNSNTESLNESEPVNADQPIALKLEQFIAVSLAYFCGATLAIPCFLIEIAINKWIN